MKECGKSSSHWSATSEEDVTHYHAYTQTTSDSAGPSGDRSTATRTSGFRRRERAHRIRNGRSFDPCAAEILDSESYPVITGTDHSSDMMFRGGHSSSDLSSPNETCYSFVRRAIQKMSTPTMSTAKMSTVRRYDEQDDSEGGSSSAMETRFPWLSLAKLEQFATPTASGARMREGPYFQVCVATF